MTLDTTSIDDTIADLELANIILREWRGPVREALHEEELGGDEFLIPDLKVHIVEVFFNLAALIVDLLDNRCLKRIKAHINEWKRRDG